jgi:hypothetical protein
VRSSCATAAGLLALSAGCAQILGVDELPIYPNEGGALETGTAEVGVSDAGPPEVMAEAGAADVIPDEGLLLDSASDCGTPEEIVFTGWSVSNSAIKFTFTPGPAYRLTRGVTHGDADGEVLFMMPQCTSMYEDGIMAGEPLNENWQYTYSLQALLPGGGDDPTFGPLTLVIQTWAAPNDPQGPSGDGSTTEWANGG